LYPLVKEVYSTFGPFLDAKTKQPLFNIRAWKDASNVLKAIQAGLLSDPPGIPLYFQIGVNKKAGIFQYIDVHEGQIMQKVEFTTQEGSILPISGVSARHASARL
jgi:hypothetical protein